MLVMLVLSLLILPVAINCRGMKSVERRAACEVCGHIVPTFL